MIQSMTGYGKTVLQLPQKKITIELKSLNSKNLDLNVRMPGYYREKELNIRKILANQLVRGKVYFSIYVEDNGGEVSSKVNEKVVKEYMNQLKSISEANELDLLKMAIRLPDSLKTEREELDEEEWSEIEKGILDTVKNIQEYRTDEGEALFTDFVMRIKNIETLLEKVIEMDPERINQVKDKLKKSALSTLTGQWLSKIGMQCCYLEHVFDENNCKEKLVKVLQKLTFYRAFSIL